VPLAGGSVSEVVTVLEVVVGFSAVMDSSEAGRVAEREFSHNTVDISWGANVWVIARVSMQVRPGPMICER
jgi:hypothetical protein